MMRLSLYVPGARWFFEKNSIKTEVDIFELQNAVGVIRWHTA